MSHAPVSTLLLGHYPERMQPPPGAAVRLARRARQWLLAAVSAARTARPLDQQPSLAELRALLARNPRDAAICEAALGRVSEACEATLGLTPYPGQVQAARALLRGDLVEMATGEGKTLAVGLAAACGALAGRPVHVVTANDYLAQRDSEWLSPLFSHLGLTCGVVTTESDRDGRRAAYACDVTYCPGRELVFDYLRDRLLAHRAPTPLLGRIAGMGVLRAPSPGLLRGLWMAIVDEADSVLLDEALMPLVLSGAAPAAESPGILALALEQARDLTLDDHFILDRRARQARLTERGWQAIRAAPTEPLRYRTSLHQVEYVETALTALYCYARDRDYLVRDQTVQIIDESTGRAAPGRVWSRELHAFVALKERCPLPPRLRTVAQITFQAFFPRYLHLCGTSGTLREERGELASVYGLSVSPVRRRLPPRLHRGRTRLFADQAAQLEAIADRVAELRAQGRPVLIAMDSVADADAVSARLLHEGIPHQTLHARQDHDEAARVATAGQPGRVTVTTNIAGRGTDIRIEEVAAAAGGLHVIACQHNRARRIDRQLSGRAARQGDPGSCERWVHIEQPLFAQTWPRTFARAITSRPLLSRGWFADRLLDIAQRRAERRARATRQAMLARDRDRGRELEIGPDA